MLCLRAATDEAWAKEAVRDLDAVLVDHAHCEMKAASNALALAARHPTRNDLVRALVDLAREETEHFTRVLDLLDARGIALGEPRVDAYAKELRHAASLPPREPALARAPSSHAALLDRLLIGALIEARSCERFKLVLAELDARGAPGSEDVLTLYRELFPAEARHYRLFVDLAVREAGGDRALVERRLAQLAQAEAKICDGLEGSPARATIHG